eukprot:13956612-Heterocapsa_arctica.AAC.2
MRVLGEGRVHALLPELRLHLSYPALPHALLQPGGGEPQGVRVAPLLDAQPDVEVPLVLAVHAEALDNGLVRLHVHCL